MANTSATGGYLAPAVDTPPLDDEELDALLRQMVSGVTGLDASLVRSRWPSTITAPPTPDTNWCAFNVALLTNDAGAMLRHESADDGSDVYIRHQDLSLLCTFYGPNATGYAQRLADGMTVAQNSEQLGLNDMQFISAGEISPVAEMVNAQWVRHSNITLKLRRKITRIYPVLNLLSAVVVTETDSTPPISGSIIIDL